jgi:hypothetical protein
MMLVLEKRLDDVCPAQICTKRHRCGDKACTEKGESGSGFEVVRNVAGE